MAEETNSSGALDNSEPPVVDIDKALQGPPSPDDNEKNNEACKKCDCIYKNIKDDVEDSNKKYSDWVIISTEKNEAWELIGKYHINIQFDLKKVDVTIRLKMDEYPSLDFVKDSAEKQEKIEKIHGWFDEMKENVNYYWSTPKTQHKIIIENKCCEDVELSVFFHLVIIAENYKNSNSSTDGATIDGKIPFKLKIDPKDKKVEEAARSGDDILVNSQNIIFTIYYPSHDVALPHEYGHLFGLHDEYMYGKTRNESKRFINYFLNEEERKNPNIGHVSLSNSAGYMKYTDTIMGSGGVLTDVEEKHYYPIAYRVQQEIYKQKGKQCEEIINVYVQ